MARAHVVCSINACIIAGIAMLTGGRHAELRFVWDWGSGCVVAGFANLVLLVALTVRFPQYWHGSWPSIVTAASVFVFLLAWAVSSIR